MRKIDCHGIQITFRHSKLFEIRLYSTTAYILSSIAFQYEKLVVILTSDVTYRYVKYASLHLVN